MKDPLPPPIEVRNIQRPVGFSTRQLRQLQRFAKVACALVWQHRRSGAEIASVAAISVLIVGDRRMAILHKTFCGLPGSTDVLTFRHGEIVISGETAARQARMFHSSLMAEIQLYLLHGLLHLAGFDDLVPVERRRMHRLQEKLLATIRRTHLSRAHS
jgi:probable rRNA maturation factor